MKTLITNLYGQGRGSVAQIAQNVTANIAREKLGMLEIGIYAYSLQYDSEDAKNARLDGVLAQVSNGDTIIFQYPTWNTIEYDEFFLNKLKIFSNLKLIIFVHDIISLMFESNAYLMKRQIDMLNQADVLILPSENMYERLKQDGLNVKKVVYQRMWDYPCDTNVDIHPPFRKGMTFIGNPDKFEFVKEWNKDFPLSVTINQSYDNIESIGYFDEKEQLLTALRNKGGFGIIVD